MKCTSKSVQAMEADIRDWIADWNTHPRPVVFTSITRNACTAGSWRSQGGENGAYTASTSAYASAPYARGSWARI